MQAAAPEAWKYADPESHDLRDAIAGLHGVEARNVVIGEGIDGLLGLAVRLVTAPGDAVVTSDGAYPTFNFHVAANGGRLVPCRTGTTARTSTRCLPRRTPPTRACCMSPIRTTRWARGGAPTRSAG